MKDAAQPEALSRLKKLAVDLSDGYAKAANSLAKTLQPLEQAIQQVDETWRPVHYAESLLSQNGEQARRPPACFAHESFVSGNEAEYVLCVERNPDRKCALYASVCQYALARPDETGKPRQGADKVTISHRGLASLDSLPVPLRVRILDILDEFTQGYESHVRKLRAGLLAGRPEAKTESPAPQAGPVPQAQAPQESELPEAEEVPEAEAAEEPAEPKSDQSSKRQRGSVKVPDVSIPLKAWLRSK